jgi:NAD(P)H-hydrate repair Nnr-like enzyme with NAD(P)H-hydrate epimerase domain
MDCDKGEPLSRSTPAIAGFATAGAAIESTYTVTFVAVKKGFISSSTAAEYTGEVFVASIGVEPAKKISD